MSQGQHRLSSLQLAVMRVVWDRGEATAQDVHAALLPARQLAPATVATILTRLEKRGLLRHRTEGRQFVFQAIATRDEVRQSMVGQLVDDLFRGDPADLVHHLLANDELGPDDREKLRALLARVKDSDAEEANA